MESWQVVYPAKRTYTFSEIVSPDAGYVEGIDSQSRNAQSMKATPPGHTMSGARLAATQRELLRASPRLLLDMLDHPDRVRPGPEVATGTESHPSVRYRDGDYEFLILFDRQTKLPVRIRSADYDNHSYDTRAATGPVMVEIGPGIQHIRGARHNSLLVEMKDYLIVFDAPITDWMSNWTLAAAKSRYPGKPVKYLILTHHHMDHAGGVRAYAAAGATLVVGRGNSAHFQRVLAAPFTGNPDLAPHDLSATPILEVADHHVISDGRRQVSAHMVGNNYHAAGMLIGYVADAQLGFVTDLWSPGRGRLPDTITPLLASVVDAVKNAGIRPLRFAGGHGTVADYAPLEALAARQTVR